MTGWTAANTSHFRPLLDVTAANFAVAEVSAGKGYLSNANATGVEKVGTTPYIAFKANTKPVPATEDSARRACTARSLCTEDFLAHYHRRSKVETTFSMINVLLSKFDPTPAKSTRFWRRCWPTTCAASSLRFTNSGSNPVSVQDRLLHTMGPLS